MLSNLLILPMLLPFLYALILVFLKNNGRISKYLYLGTMTITTIISLVLLVYVQRHRPVMLDFGGWSVPLGIQFSGDSLGLIMVTTTSLVITLIMAYRFGRDEHKANRYHLPSFILFLSVDVVNSLLISDLFDLCVMSEIMLLASFISIILGQSVEQLRATIIYVVLNIVGSWLFLLGIGLLYKTVGTLNFSHIAVRSNGMGGDHTVIMISLIFLVAFGTKAALIFFMRLPRAYAVLNTELAALFAALMTKAGAYTLIQFFALLFDQHNDLIHPLLATMAVIAMVIGAIGVIAYRDIRKVATYQAIISVEFITLGLGTNTFAGINGAIFYLINDVVVKTSLFFIVDSLVYTTGYRQYQYLNGLAKKEPLLGVAFIIVIFAIGGMPPFSGFPGKVLIFQGALRDGNYIGLALMIITSLIAMYSLFRVLFYMYFGDKDGEEVNLKRIPLHRKRILSILVVVVIAVGIAIPVVLDAISGATELNTSDQLYQELVNPYLEGED